MSERERLRIIEKEKTDLEQAAMLKHIERMREQDLREAEERKRAGQFRHHPSHSTLLRLSFTLQLQASPGRSGSCKRGTDSNEAA